MKISNVDIDFEIIWRKIHTSLSTAEEDRLMTWMEEDPRHKDFFDRVCSYYTEERNPDPDPERTQLSWEKVSLGIAPGKPGIRIRWLYSAAGLAAGMAILIGLFLLKPEKQASPVSSVIHSRIEPGSKQALLILDDGSAYDLSNESRLEIEEGGTRINSTGDALEYVEKSIKNADDGSTVELKFNTLSIPRGGEFFLTLSDGTRVWLNSETTLKYPVRFSAGGRTVELDGEAYFEVARQEGSPFRVISGEQALEVLGTSFNLSSYINDPVAYTTLVKGKVRVYLRENPEISQILNPSQQSRFERGSMYISQEYVDVGEFIAWKDGIFSFRNQDLSEMMKTVSRWYDLEVNFEQEGAKGIKFTGEVRRYENFEKILALIEKTNEVRFEVQGKTVNVR